MKKAGLWAWLMIISGLFAVYGTHIALLAGYFSHIGIAHATINLIAAVLITVGLVMKEL